jgi:hypothetical protein
MHNPLEAAHLIPYKAGCLAAYHPHDLCAPINLEWAHKNKCNKAVELPPHQWAEHAATHGIRRVSDDVKKVWSDFNVPMAVERSPVTRRKLEAAKGPPTHCYYCGEA